MNENINYPSSDERITIPSMKVQPLKKICMTIGQLPTAYIETMSYYEMLIWFIEFLRNTVIPTVNNNGEALQEVQNIVMELQNYINDYKDTIDEEIKNFENHTDETIQNFETEINNTISQFETTVNSTVQGLEDYMNNYFNKLDVQEEINNKLDQMLEDGVLEQIIEQYIQSSALWCFDNVADMKLATNFVDGSYAKTLGFHELNDGGGSTYKIRTLTNNDDVDEMTIISLNNETLIAELIINTNIINIKQFGAYCDNIHDDSNALEACLNFTNTLTSSNGTKKRTIMIPAIVKVTRRIDCKNDQIKIMGTSLNNSRIVFNGENSYLNIGKDNNETSYEIEIENIKLYGDYSQNESILKFTKCANCYLTRVETAMGGENKYNISFINCGIIFMDKCTVTGSNDVFNYPGNRNGIFIKNLLSIFNFTNANCWNLNNLFTFEGTTQNVNIENNWIECIKSFIQVNCGTDMRYMNFKIFKNTIDTHTESTNFVPSIFKFIDIEMLNDTNFYGSNISIDDNTIYLANVTSIYNNSLIYISEIGNSEYSNFSINYNRNTFSGQTLNSLSAYVFYNSETKFYNTANIRIVSFTPVLQNDGAVLTNDKKIIGCNYTGTSSRVNEFPNGVYLAQGSTYNKGNIFYENGQFWCGYNGNVKQLPERVGNALAHATSETLLSVVNSIVDTLVNAHISNRQQ